MAQQITDAPDQEPLRRIGRKVRRRLAANPAVQPIATGKAEIWGVVDFFTAEECARVIAIVDSVAQPSMAYNDSAQTNVRTSSSGDLDHRDPFVSALDQRLDRLLGLRSETGEPLQGQRYLPGQEFKEHTDWFAPISTGWAREKGFGGQRAFTAMVYLNSVEAGGETDFPKLDIAIHPRRGTLIVWNNADENGLGNAYVTHAGNPVIRGTKYVLTKWYRCHRHK